MAGTPSSHRGGDGTPLLLIHGFSDTWRGWKPVLPLLERHHDVLAATVAGHYEGAALPDGAEPTTAALADALERDMDAAGFETAHIAGNSLGGWLALELAARGRARSVVALAPAGGWERDPRIERRLGRLFRMNHCLARRSAPYADRLMRRPRIRRLSFRDVAVHPERIPPAAAAHMIKGVAGCDVYQAFIELTLRDGFPPSLAPIACPVRIAWSERDRIILPRAEYQTRLSRLVPDAEVITLAGVGHVPMHDDPELVARTITEVTARVDAGSAVSASA